MNQLSDSCLSDFISSYGYHNLYTKNQELHMLKSAKLSFYNEVTDEEKQEYLNYYLEEHPLFASKFEKANDKEKLLKKAIKNSEKAKEEFISHYFRLVINCAKKFHNKCPSIDLMDLIQMGNIGLVIALKKFDLKLNLRFSTYAIIWIKERMSYLALKERPIKFPRRKQILYSKVSAKAKQYFEETGEEPSSNELIAWGISPDNLGEYELFNKWNVSLNEPVSERKVMGDYIEADLDLENEVVDKLMKERMLYILENSPIQDEDKEIIKRLYGFYGKKETLEQIDTSLNITKNAAHWKQLKALKSLRNELYKQKFVDNRPLIKKKSFKR